MPFNAGAGRAIADVRAGLGDALTTGWTTSLARIEANVNCASSFPATPDSAITVTLTDRRRAGLSGQTVVSNSANLPALTVDATRSGRANGLVAAWDELAPVLEDRPVFDFLAQSLPTFLSGRAIRVVVTAVLAAISGFQTVPNRLLGAMLFVLF
jgi:hypothetical protein